MEKRKAVSKHLEEKEIKLLSGGFQKYYLDKNPKAPIAITKKKDKQIYVNDSFEGLKKNEKLSIIYHEIGHSKFILWKPFLEFAGILLSISVLITFFPIMFLILNYSFSFNIFNIPNLIWLIFLILGLIIFSVHTAFYWFLEIIADVNSIAKIDKKYLIKLIEKEYSSNKRNFWDKYITHPSWKLRKKIMEAFE